MLGYGQNLQHCTSMIFSGFNESFEDLYQAIRRAYRDGQTHSVRVHFVLVEELEGDTFANLNSLRALPADVLAEVGTDPDVERLLEGWSRRLMRGPT